MIAGKDLVVDIHERDGGDDHNDSHILAATQSPLAEEELPPFVVDGDDDGADLQAGTDGGIAVVVALVVAAGSSPQIEVAPCTPSRYCC